MSFATIPKSDSGLLEIEEALFRRNEDIKWEKLSTWGKIIGLITMTIQKVTTPSITTSPAIIALTLSLIVQSVIIVWWAAGLSKDNAANMEKIKELQSNIETQKVYIDNTREKFIKMEAIVNNMQNEKQLEDLLLKQKTGGK